MRAEHPNMVTREEAASKGLKRFFTAVACFRGHECERLVSNGLCIECARLNKKADKERNPERERARRRKYAAENPERVKAWRKATEVRHGKRVQKRDQRGKSKLLSPEKRREYQSRWRHGRSSEYIRQQTAKRAERDKLNPEGRRVRDRNRRSRKASAEGSHSEGDIRKLFAAQKGKCATCRMAVAFDEKHVDHVLPLSRGGTNWPNNLQILCEPCNLRKSAKHPVEWARENGLLI